MLMLMLLVKSKENNRSLFSIYANQRVFELEYAFQSNLPPPPLVPPALP